MDLSVHQDIGGCSQQFQAHLEVWGRVCRVELADFFVSSKPREIYLVNLEKAPLKRLRRQRVFSWETKPSSVSLVKSEGTSVILNLQSLIRELQ